MWVRRGCVRKKKKGGGVWSVLLVVACPPPPRAHVASRAHFCPTHVALTYADVPSNTDTDREIGFSLFSKPVCLPVLARGEPVSAVVV